MSDLFAPWTKPEWRNEIINSLLQCPVKHTFQLLTKNPENIPEDFVFPGNFWIGTTVTCENQDWINLDFIKKVKCGIRFASFEPLLGMLPKDVSLKGLDWIIIGKLTGSNRVKLDPAWVQRITLEANDLGIPIFLKNNLLRHLAFPRVQHFPGEELSLQAPLIPRTGKHPVNCGCPKCRKLVQDFLHKAEEKGRQQQSC